MSLSTSETYHHTPEQVRGYIKAGEEILQGLGYTDEERVQLLPSIVGLLSSKSITVVERRPTIATALGELDLSGRRQ